MLARGLLRQIYIEHQKAAREIVREYRLDRLTFELTPFVPLACLPLCCLSGARRIGVKKSWLIAPSRCSSNWSEKSLILAIATSGLPKSYSALFNSVAVQTRVWPLHLYLRLLEKA